MRSTVFKIGLQQWLLIFIVLVMMFVVKNTNSNSIGKEETSSSSCEESDPCSMPPPFAAGMSVLSYGALGRQQFCQSSIYGNCIGVIRPGYRPCSYYTRCRF
ncbi:hypothetical protein M5689_007438 [Euphorbia peplus]|nr:hypothetical protein M5689_007438 [Euphorbia peplus]